MRFERLFSPISINKMELKNRIVMTAMHLGYTPEGEVTDRLVDYYGERAKGGVGLIVVGGCPVDEYGGMPNMIRIDQDRYIPGLKRLTFAVQTEGARIAAQLYQAGRYTHSAMIGGRKPFSASAIRSRLTGETPRALELEEIPGVQDSFARAAVRARKAGFDAVEVLASAGYLISQFLSPLTNRREDRYGGSLENRMRFGLEVVDKVRSALGPDYPVIVRIAGNDFMEGGNTNKEARTFAAELEKIGVDLFNVTGGWHETRVPQITMNVPRGAYVYLARGIKSTVSVPVLASNRINDPGEAEEILLRGDADLVTMARGLMADPYLPIKALEGEEQRIYHCIGCNQGCFDNVFRSAPVACLVNPRAGLEGEIRVEPAENRKKVLIVGGGPAGMKAACTAAERGHQVILMEKSDSLGGQLLLNRVIPGREEMVTAAADLARNMEALGINVVLGKEADRRAVEDEAPDVVVIAVGAEPIVPDIPGIDRQCVIQAWDLLSGKACTGRRVVIIGGNAVGLETALHLANQGTLPPGVLHFLAANRAETWENLAELIDRGSKEVIVVEMAPKAGKDIGGSTRWTIMAELGRLGVRILTGTRALAITDQGVQVEREGAGEEILPADTVVVAAGSESIDTLSDRIADLVKEIYVIGDARKPRNALEAVKEAFMTALKI